MVYLIHFQRPYRLAWHYIGFVAVGGLAGRLEPGRGPSGFSSPWQETGEPT